AVRQAVLLHFVLQLMSMIHSGESGSCIETLALEFDQFFLLVLFRSASNFPPRMHQHQASS
ncbi:hypothetical protein ACH5RR_025632, partial [Cinchona calisaya]